MRNTPEYAGALKRARQLRRVRNSALLIFLTMGGQSVVLAQSAENVAVIINESDEASVDVGQYYVQQRRIPASNVIRIKTTTEESIERAAYASTIESPVAEALARGQLQDRILYIVLTKGIPLRIVGTHGQAGTTASVDSELTLMYRRMLGQTVLTLGRVDNPYYLGARDLGDARPFTHREHDIFLVSRLDGFTADDARALIDRASKAGTDGAIVLDQRVAPGSSLGDEWLAAAAKRLSIAGHADRTVLEMSAKPARHVGPVLGYYSWGSTDSQNRERSVAMRFTPGAVAASFVNTDARTFHEPPASWRPTGNSLNRSAWFEGSAHSLIGDLIREGVTGVAGHLSEPYLQSVVRPDVLFAAYLAGHNLIESYYLALPHLSWQTVIVGDPLCAPFRRAAPAATDLDPPIEADTTLPAFFSARRVERLTTMAPGVSSAAVVAWARAWAQLVRGDLSGARQALEQSIALAPRFVETRVALGILYQAVKNAAAAVEQYRVVLELEPNRVEGLNNLAYALAVDQSKPQEALPFARRAYALAPTNASVLDTLGWTEHLLGENTTAAKHLAEAVRRDPSNANIRLHAAIVYAATGVRSLAEAELKEVLRLAPQLAETDQVQQLKATLAGMKP